MNISIHSDYSRISHFVSPDAKPFAEHAEQMDLIARAKVNHFFDADVGSEKEQEAAARIAAERAYTQRLMSVPVEELKSGEKWSMDQWWPRV